MSQRAVRVGCPNCERSAVEVATGSRTDPPFPDADRLKGTTTDCTNCGGEFEVYFY